MIPSLSFIAPPMLGFPGVAVTAMQTLISASSYSNEVSNASPYSKFFDESKGSAIDSKIGMTILYGLPLVTAASLWGFAKHNGGVAPLAGMLTTLHFLKRVLEVQFIHTYSGKMSKPMSIVIGIYYSLTAALLASVGTVTPTKECSIVGNVLFGLGSLGNLYHHYLLRRLRDNAEGYVMPTGGFFDYAAAPHYLFELIAWAGIAISSQHGNAFLVFTGMTSYLSGRAVAQNRWNEQKFPEWKNKQNLIPFVF